MKKNDYKNLAKLDKTDYFLVGTNSSKEGSETKKYSYISFLKQLEEENKKVYSLLGHTHTESDITDLQNYLISVAFPDLTDYPVDAIGVLTNDGIGNLSWSPLPGGGGGDVAESTHLQVKNTSGSLITKGTPVYITGNVGNTDKLEIAPADASSASTMPAVGLLESDLANNGEGFVVQGGFLKGLATATIDGTSTSSNDTVYVKSGGGLTMTKPTGASNLIQNIAKVARVHASNGSLVVSSILRANDVPNITQDQLWLGNASGVATPTDHTVENISNVTVSPKTDGQALVWDAVNNYWKNGTVSGSVNGFTGIVVLDTDDINEGVTNFYYTDARVAANAAVALNTAKVTNATHTGDVTGDTVLTIAAGAVDISMLSAGGTPDGTTFLRGDNSWSSVGFTDLSGTLTSAQLRSVITDETGTGSLVFGTSPTLTTPNLGTPSVAVLTNATGLVATTGLTATGTKDSTTFLRGDNTWAVPAGGGGGGAARAFVIVQGGRVAYSGTNERINSLALGGFDGNWNFNVGGTNAQFQGLILPVDCTLIGARMVMKPYSGASTQVDIKIKRKRNITFNANTSIIDTIATINRTPSNTTRDYPASFGVLSQDYDEGDVITVSFTPTVSSTSSVTFTISYFFEER